MTGVFRQRALETSNQAEIIVGAATAGDLASQLEKLGVGMTSSHPALGKPSDQIQDLVNKK